MLPRAKADVAASKLANNGCLFRIPSSALSTNCTSWPTAVTVGMTRKMSWAVVESWSSFTQSFTVCGKVDDGSAKPQKHRYN